MRRALAFGFALAATTVGLVACGPTEDACPNPQGTSVVFIVQATANTPSLSVSQVGEAEKVALRKAITCQRTVKVIAADGRPYELGPDHAFVDDKQLIPKDRDAARTFYFNSVFALIDKVEAKSNGLDMLAALRMAAGELNGGGGQIFVYGSGMSDSGAYNVAQKGMSTAGSDLVLPNLATEIPNLKDATVVWHWFAQAYGDQKSLSGAQIANLKDVERKVIEKGGGSVRFDDSSASTTTPLAKHGDFTLTPVEPVTISFPTPANGQTIVYDASVLGFVPDTDTFLDGATAHQFAAVEAAWLTDHVNGCLRIVGTTANFGTEEGLRALSTKRAAAFARLIADAGGDASRMSTVGVGIHFTDFQKDGGPKGPALIGPAQANRSVRVSHVIPLNSGCQINRAD